MHTIDLYRGDIMLATIKPDPDAQQSKKVMGDNVLTISFDDTRYLGLQVSDYCIVFGEKYILSTPPVVNKKSKVFFHYDLTFISEGSTLGRIQYLFLGEDNSLKETDFSLMGNADTFMDLLISNTQRIDNSWVKGEVIPTDYINLTFSKSDCLSALATIAQAFKTEFWIQGKTIHLVQKQFDTGRIFKQGKGQGLYEITPVPLDGSSVVTRLYIYGSDKNLPPLYAGGATRLQIPGPSPCYVSNVIANLLNDGVGTVKGVFSFDPPSNPGITGLIVHYVSNDGHGYSGSASVPNTSPCTIPGLLTGTYDFTFETVSGDSCNGHTTLPISLTAIQTANTQPYLVNNLPFVESNVDKYGVIEAVQVFDDIYPHRTGKVSSVDATTPFVFSDGSMDFDLNSFLLPGTTAKVTFNTGQLAGYTFDIKSYDNSLKKFTILINKAETAIQVPSDSIRPAIGDQYVLIDIFMPDTYVRAAEADLKAAALTAIAQLSQQQQKFNLLFDPVYLKRKLYAPQIGDLIWIQDDQFALNRKIRVVATSRNLTNEYNVTVDVADAITSGFIAALINTSNQNTTDISSINSQLENKRVLNQAFVGAVKIDQIPTTAVTTGFSPLYIDNTTGIVYKKV